MEFTDISKKLVGEKVSKKRRRRVEEKVEASITGCNKDLHVKPNVAPDGSVSYTVVSGTDPTKSYQVGGRFNGIQFKLNCTCGKQFGMKYRDNCKHILATIIFQMGSYFQHHFEMDGVKIDEAHLSHMIDSFKF